MLSDAKPLRIGTRTSPMAMAQARLVRDHLARTTDIPTEIVGVETSGDRWYGDLSELGGKGAFLREVDRRLLAGEVDIAVHSVKDVPGDDAEPEGTEFTAYLRRQEPLDALVLRKGSRYRTLSELPPGTRVGTSAVRRRSQLLKHRPDLHVLRIRGNVNQRLDRMDGENTCEGLVLNAGGLARAELGDRISQVIPRELLCPAVGAGVVGARVRSEDTELAGLLRTLDDPDTRLAVTAERAMLVRLQGDCGSPVAGHCTVEEDGSLSLVGMVFSDCGGAFLCEQANRPASEAEALGEGVADALLSQGARPLLTPDRRAREERAAMERRSRAQYPRHAPW